MAGLEVIDMDRGNYTSCSVCGVKVKASCLSKHLSRVHGKNINIKNLATVRSRVDRVCSMCGVTTNKSWIYNFDDQDKVYLCCKCRPMVLKRMFKRRNHKVKVISAGAFESNRRRH